MNKGYNSKEKLGENWQNNVPLSLCWLLGSTAVQRSVGRPNEGSLMQSLKTFRTVHIVHLNKPYLTPKHPHRNQQYLLPSPIMVNIEMPKHVDSNSLAPNFPRE